MHIETAKALQNFGAFDKAEVVKSTIGYHLFVIFRDEASGLREVSYSTTKTEFPTLDEVCTAASYIGIPKLNVYTHQFEFL